MTKEQAENSSTLVTYRRIWALAWPMIIANLSIPLLGIVDTAILGHLPDSSHLSAVAIGSSLLAFIYWGFSFLKMGTTGSSAQTADPHIAAKLLVKSLLLAPIVATGILLCSPLWLPLGINIMNTPPQLMPLAESYLQIRLFGVFAVMANYTAVGWLIGQQKTRWALAIAVSTNLCNIALDFLFIVGLDMRSEGAALASAISEYLGLGVAFCALRKPLRQAVEQGLLNSLRQGPALKSLIQQNLHLFIRTVCLLFSFTFFIAQSANQGSTVLAANSILLQLALAAAYGMDGFAHAAEALAGRAYSQGDRSGFLLVCRNCGVLSLFTAVMATLGLALFQTSILQLLTSLPDVLASASTYYPYLIAMPLISMASYLLDGIFVGSLQTRTMMHNMLFSVFVVFLPIWYLGVDEFGNHAVWWALLGLTAARGASLAIAFQRKFSSQRWPQYSSR